MTEELGEGAGATQQQKLPQDAAPQEKKAGGPFASLKRMPANTAFKQQRLKAWQPILTPRSVWPSFVVIGISFICLGVGLYISSNNVQEYIFDYTYCGDNSKLPANIDAWSYSSTNHLCTMTFTLPSTMTAPVFLYYRLTNFYQNHRRYVKSRSINQLRGEAVDAGTLSKDCDPLTTLGSAIIYPCGLIANSYFSDDIGVNPANYAGDIPTAYSLNQLKSGSLSYQFDDSQIAWPSDAVSFGPTQYSIAQITTPPAWKYYKGQDVSTGWTPSTLASFNPQQDQHFQVWMRTAGLPTFRKLYGKNQDKDLTGKIPWTIAIHSVFDTLPYEGTKSIVLSTTSWLGGKNNFLGIAYMSVGAICLVLGLLFMARHLIKPRKLGDHTYLSWHNPANASSEQENPLLRQGDAFGTQSVSTSRPATQS